MQCLVGSDHKEGDETMMISMVVMVMMSMMVMVMVMISMMAIYIL